MELGGGGGALWTRRDEGNGITVTWAPVIPKWNTRMYKQLPPPLSCMNVLTSRVAI